MRRNPEECVNDQTESNRHCKSTVAIFLSDDTLLNQRVVENHIGKNPRDLDQRE